MDTLSKICICWLWQFAPRLDCKIVCRPSPKKQFPPSHATSANTIQCAMAKVKVEAKFHHKGTRIKLAVSLHYQNSFKCARAFIQQHNNPMLNNILKIYYIVLICNVFSVICDESKLNSPFVKSIL